MNQNTTIITMTIHQFVFIWDLIIKEQLSDCNSNIISIEVDASIKMLELDNNKKSYLYKYKRLVKRFMYLWCDIRLDIAFIVR